MSAQPEHYIITQGGAACPVIIHVPHSSREIPEEVAADFVATDAQLAPVSYTHLTLPTIYSV